jgi:hypothetical protein
MGRGFHGLDLPKANGHADSYREPTANGGHLRDGEFYENKSTAKILSLLKFGSDCWYENYISFSYGGFKCRR